MPKPDLSIIIVNWKVRDLLEQCLDSIFKYRGDYNIEVFVIDNNSGDGSAEMVRRSYPQVNLIALDKNIGFGSANNIAIERVKADYIFLLNPDSQISRHFLKDALSYMDAHQEVSMLAPKIYNQDGTVQESIRRTPDFQSQILVLLKLINVFPNNKILKHYLYKDFDYHKEQVVEQIKGAAMLIRKSVFEQIGKFDEHFFLWFEEVDLCKRAKDAGVVIKYFPKAYIVHQGGKSFSKEDALKKQRYFNKSLIYYFSKHHSFWNVWILRLLIPINLLLTFLYAIFLKTKRI